MATNYDNLVEALAHLKERGFAEDFRLDSDALQCSNKLRYSPEQLTIVETHRFEGMTNPADSSALYVLRADDGTQGSLVAGYGPGAQEASEELIARMNKTSG